MSTLDYSAQLTNLPAWQRGRCKKLHELCLLAAEKIALGVSKRVAFADVAAANQGLSFPVSEGVLKPFRLSYRTMQRAFYDWKVNPTPRAFVMDYKPGRQAVPFDLVQEFQRRCTRPGMAAMSVAYKSLLREWREEGKALPGLGTWQEYWRAQFPTEPMPDQAPEFPWSESSFYRKKPRSSERALGTRGWAAAKRELPFITRSYAELRPCELYVLDDARLDILAIDDASGKAVDHTVYLMMEVCSRAIVGFVLRPATRILAADVEALVARVLRNTGIGVGYATHLYFERGTVACTPARQTFIETMLDGRVVIHRTGMDGGRVHVGAFEDKASGHWMGKGVIESFVRKLHLYMMDKPGQRGSTYDRQPAELPARVAEAEQLAAIQLGTDQRVRLKGPLLWTSEVNGVLREVIKRHNLSRDHQFEDFGQVTQYFDEKLKRYVDLPEGGLVVDGGELNADLLEKPFRKVNRAPREEFSARLDQVQPPEQIPDSIVGLLLSVTKEVTVDRNGIHFEHLGKPWRFWHPDSVTCLDQVAQKVLVSWDPDKPEMAHVITRDGRYVESVPVKNRPAWFDQEALASELADHKRVYARVAKRLQDLHVPDAIAEIERAKTNAETLQIVNTLDLDPTPREVGTDRRAVRESDTPARAYGATAQTPRDTGATTTRDGSNGLSEPRAAGELSAGDHESARTAPGNGGLSPRTLVPRFPKAETLDQARQRVETLVEQLTAEETETVRNDHERAAGIDAKLADAFFNPQAPTGDNEQ